MRRLLALVLLFVMLASFSHASGFFETEKIPTSYPYTWDAKWLLFPDNAAQWTGELGISSANQSSKKVADALTAEEKKAFSKSMSLLSNSDAYLASAKRLHMEALSWRIFYQRAYSFPNGQFLAVIFVAKEDTAIVFSLKALSQAAFGINEALLLLDSETDKLEAAGADYSNYTGSASGTYNELKTAMAAIRENKTEGSGLGNKYAKTLWLAKGIATSVSKKGTLSLNPPGAFPAAMDTLSGTEGVFASIVKLRRESIVAFDQMNNEYSQLDGLCEAKAASVKAELARMDKDGYGRIDKQMVLDFYGGNFNWGASGLPPSESVVKTARLATNRGLDPGAEQLLSDARELVKAKGNNYLALGINTLAQCIGKTREAESQIEETDKLVGELKQRATQLASEKQKAAKDALDGFSPKNDDEKALYQKAKSKYDEAEGKIRAVRYSNSGTLLSEYSEAIVLYGEVALMLSDPSANLENVRNKAKASLEHLKETIKKAKSDGLEVSEELDYAESVDWLVQTGKLDLLESVYSTCKMYESEIERKAANRYSDLDVLRAEIASSFGSDESPAKELEDDYATFTDYELTYVENGTISPRLALGNYKKLEAFYQRFSDKISQYRAISISKSLENNAQSIILFERLPLVDQSVPVSVEITLRNGLGIGYSGPVAAEVPLDLEVRSSEIVEKSQEIEEVAYANGKLLVLFKRVEPNGYYRILFRSDRTIAQSKSPKISDELIGPQLLLHRVELEFTSKMDTTIGISLSLPDRPALESAELNGHYADIETTGIGEGTVVLIKGDAAAGDNKLLAEFTFQTPVNITKRVDENWTTEEGTISYRVEVSSPFEIKNVPVYVTEPFLKGGEATVTGLFGWDPKDVGITKIGEGGQISWTVSELRPGLTALFRVSFSVDDEITTAKRLYNETMELAKAMNSRSAEDELAFADSLIKSGAYKKAIEMLEETRDRLDKSTQSQIDYENVAKSELEKLAAQLSDANVTINQLREFGYNATDLTSVLDSATEKYERSKELLGEGKTKESLSATSDGLAISAQISYSPVFRRRDEVSSQLGKAKRDALLLSQLTPTEDILARISSLEQKLSEADSSLSAGQYGKAAAAIETANAGIANISASIVSKADSWYSTFKQQSIIQREILDRTDQKLDLLSRAFTISETRVGKVSGLEPSFDLEETRRQMDSADRHLSNVFDEAGKAGNSTEFVLKNAANLNVATDELNGLSEIESRVAAELDSLRSRAYRGVDNAELAIAQLSELKSGDSGTEEEMNTLKTYLTDSGKAIEEGRLADSLALSGYVQKRVSYLLKVSPQKKDDSNIFLIGGISILLLFALLAIFILRGGKKKEEPQMKSVPRTEKKID